MRKLGRVGVFLGGVVLVSALTAVLMVGCGGDDTVVLMDAAADSLTADVTIDTSDTGMGTDTGSDAGRDSRNVFDAGPPALLDYVHQINDIFCHRLAECCGAATFDVAQCISDANLGAQPGIANQNMFAPFLDGGHITFDLAKAADCLSKVGSLSCGAVTSSYMTDLMQTCYSGAVGDIPLGGPGCRGAAECAPPNHCDTSVDGGGPGLGKCVAPLAVGSACLDLASGFESHAQCGSLLTGVPGYCNSALRDFQGTGKCEAQRPLDAGCYQSVECASNICGDPTDPTLITLLAGQCNPTLVIANAGLCTNYLIVDAGGQ